MSSFNNIFDRILSGLPDNYYLAGHKEDGTFAREILQRYESQADIDPHTVESEAMSSWKITPRTQDDLISLACAYAIAARRANGKDPDKAWEYLCQAHYWYGVSSATVVLPDAIERSHATRASSGASKRDGKYEPLRQLARELAASGKYASKRNAALSIKDRILAESRDRSVTLSDAQAERTITKWLDGMSFGSKE